MLERRAFIVGTAAAIAATALPLPTAAAAPVENLIQGMDLFLEPALCDLLIFGRCAMIWDGNTWQNIALGDVVEGGVICGFDEIEPLIPSVNHQLSAYIRGGYHANHG